MRKPEHTRLLLLLCVAGLFLASAFAEEPQSLGVIGVAD